MTLRVGLTGSIGSGKSTVARALAARGAGLIDADALAREATEDEAVVREVAAALGPELLRDGVLDRRAVAGRVFHDPEALRVLESIVHPRVRAASAARERELVAAGARVVVHDVPLLFERGLDGAMDATVVVTAPLELRVARAARRGGQTEADVLARDARQMPQAEKAARATFVIDNGGTLGELEARVDALWRELRALEAAPRRGAGERM